ncbi:class I SAM-dependent methyltransferase [soil metagenome]
MNESIEGGETVAWKAEEYDKLEKPHEAWARQVLGRLELSGDETILDAGCGTGALTKLLVELVPNGRVIGTDSSPSMLAQARETLGEDVELIESDLTKLELETKVDVVFSNATFHWVSDHDALFARMFEALKPGGRIEAQCGGDGNIAELERQLEALSGDERFAPYLRTDRHAWNYASVGDTVLRLNRSGFESYNAGLEPWPVTPADPSGFLRTVILQWHLDRLPNHLHEPFIDTVLENATRPLTIDYVRLNISARRPI